MALGKDMENFEKMSGNKIAGPKIEQKYDWSDFDKDVTKSIKDWAKYIGIEVYEGNQTKNATIDSSDTNNPYRTASLEQMKAFVDFQNKINHNPSYKPNDKEIKAMGNIYQGWINKGVAGGESMKP